MNSDSDEVVTGSGNSSDEEIQNGETMELPEVGNQNLLFIYDHYLDFNVSRLLWIKGLNLPFTIPIDLSLEAAAFSSLSFISEI